MQAGQGLERECWQLRLDVVGEQQLAKLPDLAADRVACATTKEVCQVGTLQCKLISIETYTLPLRDKGCGEGPHDAHLPHHEQPIGMQMSHGDMAGLCCS